MNSKTKSMNESQQSIVSDSTEQQRSMSASDKSYDSKDMQNTIELMIHSLNASSELLDSLND